ncbi:hypothetical protein OHA70_23140 [Kribbella sp. NBC_00382]|uniref:hypothetical protein n=1 Tax=Kribbella sp. NBC_00382 TaxID=2975967 RepID=UPI002E24BECE
MYRSKTSRTLGRAAVAAAALASVALLPAGVANATPLTEAAPATVDYVTCTIHGQPGQPIMFYQVKYGVGLGYVYDGQKVNQTGRDSEWSYGVLWGRTDVTKVAARYVYC